MRRRFGCLLLIVLITISFFSGCKSKDLGSGTLHPTAEDDDSLLFEELTDAWFARRMSEDPLSCHFTVAHPETYGISFTSETFTDLTYEQEQAELTSIHRFLKDLKKISKEDLSHRQQLVYDLLLDYYDLQMEFADYYYYQDPLSPTDGIPGSLPVLLSSFAFRDTSDIELYLNLLNDIDIYFGQLYAFAQEKTAQGLMTNDTTLQQTITFCQSFSQASPDHLLLASFQERITSCDFLTEQEKQKYLSQNSNLVNDVVLPSYLSLADNLMSILGKNDNSGCLCHLPDGYRYYALLVRQSTGTDRSPFLLFQDIANQRQEDLKAMASYFRTNPALASVIQQTRCPLSEPTDMMEVLQDAMEKDYPTCPELSVTIRQVPEQLASCSAPAYYLIAPIDDYQQHDIFFQPKSSGSTLSLFTTMAHEGFPGHLYQTAMSYSYDYEPVRSLLSYPGYVEGWATYVEFDSYRYAGIDDDAAAVLSLNQRVVLSLYASADIGIHYYGWDTGTLANFLSEYGISDEQVIEEIYQLILASPANYLKYYVGQMNFSSLLEECRTSYPDCFTKMDFHKCILQTGPASFAILKQELFDYFDTLDALQSQSSMHITVTMPDRCLAC